MTAYTRNANGDWSTSTEWTPNGVPGDGDTAVTSVYSVTVDQAVTLGIAGATGTVALTINDGGTVVQNNDMILKGDIALDDGYTWTQSAKITWRPPTGSRYQVTHTGVSTGRGTWTATTGAEFDSDLTGGGSNGWIDKASTSPADITWNSMILRNQGGASQNSILMALGGTDTFYHLAGLVIEYGQYRVTNANATSWRTDGVSFRDGVDASGDIMQFNGYSASAVAGIREFTNNDVYVDPALTQRLRERCSELNYDGTHFLNVSPSPATLSNRKTISNVFFVESTGGPTLGMDGTSDSTISDSAFIVKGDGNPHYINFGSGANGGADTIMQDCVCDGFGLITVEVGDILIDGTANVQRVLLTNNAGAFTLRTSSTRFTADRLTIWNNGVGTVNFGETNGDALQGVSIDHCLFGDQDRGIQQDGAFVTQTNLLLRYNGFHNMLDATNLDLGSDNSYISAELIAAWKTAATYGVTAGFGDNDLLIDPNFVDDTRTANTWCTANGMGSVTLVNLIAELAKKNGYDINGDAAVFDENFALQSYLNYMRTGYAPRNAGVEVDGTTLGAMELHILADVGFISNMVSSHISNLTTRLV